MRRETLGEALDFLQPGEFGGFGLVRLDAFLEDAVAGARQGILRQPTAIEIQKHSETVIIITKNSRVTNPHFASFSLTVGRL